MSDGDWWFLGGKSWPMLSYTPGVISLSCPGAGQIGSVWFFSYYWCAGFKIAGGHVFLDRQPYLSCNFLWIPQTCTRPLWGVSHYSIVTIRLAHSLCPSADLRDLPFGNAETCGVIFAALWDLRGMKRGWVILFTLQPHHVLLAQILHEISCLQYLQMRQRYHLYGPASMQTSKVLCSGLCSAWPLEFRKCSGTNLSCLNSGSSRLFLSPPPPICTSCGMVGSERGTNQSFCDSLHLS